MLKLPVIRRTFVKVSRKPSRAKGSQRMLKIGGTGMSRLSAIDGVF